jgi:hypothetical protein
MTHIKEKFDKLQLDSRIVRELGLSKDWKKQISPDFLNKVVNTAEKYKATLRELSKY